MVYSTWTHWRLIETVSKSHNALSWHVPGDFFAGTKPTAGPRWGWSFWAADLWFWKAECFWSWLLIHKFDTQENQNGWVLHIFVVLSLGIRTEMLGSVSISGTWPEMTWVCSWCRCDKTTHGRYSPAKSGLGLHALQHTSMCSTAVVVYKPSKIDFHQFSINFTACFLQFKKNLNVFDTIGCRFDTFRHCT